MKRINVLNENTYSKIAAGEVVERPSSVVKELVENSIDSGAENIILEINEGGTRKIKVTDDGAGIHPDDIKNAFVPHATSKISDIDDIFSIRTMGFRGEALASIASVSKIDMKTRTKDNEYGKEIYIEGGDIKYIKDTACNVGTVVEVNDLFYNVPARLKFMKSQQRETSFISDIASRLAIANYDISFKVINNGKNILNTYGSKNLKDALRYIYDKNICENIIEFETEGDTVSVYGYVGNEKISRGSRNNQSIFANKRYIKSKLITAAAENAFKSFSTVNKFPFFVLFIDIYPEFIDINVHPSKTEIKFKDERQIFKIVFDAVHSALCEDLKAKFAVPKNISIPVDLKPSKNLTESNNQCLTNDSYVNNNIINSNNSNSNNLNNNNLNNKLHECIVHDASAALNNNNVQKSGNSDNVYENSEKDLFQKDLYKNTSLKSEENNNIKENYFNTQQTFNKDIDKNIIGNNIEVNENQKADELKFPLMRIIGQYNNTYILAESNTDLYMIDQHAAHEKILFEKYRKEILNQNIVSQLLVQPEIIELNFDEFSIYDENKLLFKNCGFDIDLFGQNTISIKEIPYTIGKCNVRQLLLEIIDNLKNMGTGSKEEVKYNAIARLACKSAVKANNKLTELEMNTLINTLRNINEPFTCPHGRPTIIKLTLTDIEKKFKRIP